MDSVSTTAIPEYAADTLFAKQSGRNLNLPNPGFSRKWNWGAFFFSWLWLFYHGKTRLGVLFLVLDAIPGVGLCAHIYCGIRGNDLAYDGRAFTSAVQFAAVQNAWRNVGFVLSSVVFGMVFSDVGAHWIATHHTTRMAHLRASNRTARPYLAVHIAPNHAVHIAQPNHAVESAQPRVAVTIVQPRHTIAIAHADVPQRRQLPVTVSIDRPIAATPHLAAPRATPNAITIPTPQPHPTDLAALNAHPCESALQEVEDALTAVTDQPRYASSVRALYYAAKCGKRAIRLRTRALALTQKAIAEHNRRMGDWHADISESFNVAMQCANDGADANDPNGAACHALANQQAQLALIWQIDR